jgi:hypothetical protein
MNEDDVDKVDKVDEDDAELMLRMADEFEDECGGGRGGRSDKDDDLLDYSALSDLSDTEKAAASSRKRSRDDDDGDGDDDVSEDDDNQDNQDSGKGKGNGRGDSDGDGDSDSDSGYSETYSDEQEEQEEQDDEQDSDVENNPPRVANNVVAASSADGDGNGGDGNSDMSRIRARYQRLLKRYLDSDRTPYSILLDECDFDVRLSHDEALRGTGLGKSGYASAGEVTKRMCTLMDELVDVELAMHRFNVKTQGNGGNGGGGVDKAKQANAVFLSVNRVFEGEVSESFNQMRRVLDLMFTAVRACFELRGVAGGVNSAITTKEMIRNYRSDRATQNINLRAITFFLEQASLRRLRKMKPQGPRDETWLYEPLVINGYTTVSFRRVCTLEAWVNEMVRADIYPDLFNALCSKATTLPNARRYLETTEDSRLPFYEVSDYIHGFENCYVDTFACKAYFYADNPRETRGLVARQHHADVVLEKSWFSMRERRRACVEDLEARTWTFRKRHLDGTTRTLVCPFPADYRAAGRNNIDPPPLHLDMPAMQQMLDFQEFTAEMQSMFYCMLGRTLLPVNTRDKFDCIVLMSGETQSGKSTALDAITESLHPNRERVAVLSSNKEDKFGLQTAYNKDIMICDEMERKPSWNLGEIKSMATGSWMSIAVKNGDAVYTRWRAPILISSNYKVPEWGGGGNDVYALVRRFAPFPFPRTVTRPDRNLPVQLNGVERGRIFVSCLLNYDWTLRYVGKSAFNKVAPPPLLKALKEMLCELHPLVHFLETSVGLRFAPEGASDVERRAFYMPFENLKVQYEEWLKTNHIKSDNKWLPEFYKAPLLSKGCSVADVRESKSYPRTEEAAKNMFGDTKRCIYVYGVDMAD